MDAEQTQKLTDLLTSENMAILSTAGEEWPTAHFQSFGQTDSLDLIFIMLEDSDKFQNLVKRPQVTVAVDNREKADPASFQIVRSTIKGIAREVARDSDEWNTLKDGFLQKNPFEEPFFGYDTLRMVSVAPKHVSYANGLEDSFKADL